MNATMEAEPQMFFVRSCAEILPAWLKAPIPGLRVLDKPISWLSLLDRPLVARVEQIHAGEDDLCEVLLSEELWKEEADPSFYIEGAMCFGLRSKYAVNGEDFFVDENTVISGELLYGAYAAVQGVIEVDGKQRATIIVMDKKSLH